MKRTRKSLKNELWKVFSKWVRQRDRNICFTCGKKADYPQAGHFIPRSVGGLTLYFHEDNVHCQCSTCNLTLQGNVYEYGKRLGEEKVQELYKLKQQTTKDFPFQEKIDYYTAHL